MSARRAVATRWGRDTHGGGGGELRFLAGGGGARFGCWRLQHVLDVTVCAGGFEDFAGRADWLRETVGEGELFDALAFGGWEPCVDADLLGELVKVCVFVVDGECGVARVSDHVCLGGVEVGEQEAAWGATEVCDEVGGRRGRGARGGGGGGGWRGGIRNTGGTLAAADHRYGWFGGGGGLGGWKHICLAAW